MGTIASVLQWTCTNCNLINPTECLKCLQCGNIRILKSVESGGVYGEDEGSGGGGGDDDGNTDDSLQCGGGAGVHRITKCGNSRVKHKTLPGYVEISSNG